MPARPLSIAPHGPEQDTYLVLDDFGGSLGCSWHETDQHDASAAGEFNSPIRIVAFYTVEGWRRDVTVNIADELRRRYVEFGEVPESIFAFMDNNRR